MKKHSKPSPSTTDANGRDQRGRFTAGNRAAKGNPYAQRVAILRAAIINTIDDEDVAQVVAQLIAQAKNGDVAAAKLFLERVFGPPVPLDLIARIEELELALQKTQQ